jgi:hypothetical protein
VDPGAAVDDIRTMNDRLYDSLARQRFATTMLAAFSGLALILAAVGGMITLSSHESACGSRWRRQRQHIEMGGAARDDAVGYRDRGLPARWC